MDYTAVCTSQWRSYEFRLKVLNSSVITYLNIHHSKHIKNSSKLLNHFSILISFNSKFLLLAHSPKTQLASKLTLNVIHKLLVHQLVTTIITHNTILHSYNIEMNNSTKETLVVVVWFDPHKERKRGKDWSLPSDYSIMGISKSLLTSDFQWIGVKKWKIEKKDERGGLL